MKNQNPTYQRIRRYVEQLIEKNYHNPTYMLPSENSLANTFQTSRTPVQKVLADLQEEGFIYKVQGKGTFISQTDAPQETVVFYALFPHVHTRYMQDVISGMNDYFKDKNAMLTIMLTDDDPEEEKRKLEYIMAHNGAGILFYPIITQVYHDVVIKLLLKDYDVVLVANRLERLKFGSVYCDYYAQLYEITEHLIGEGHTEIAFISEQRIHPTYRSRVQAHWDCILKKTSHKDIRLLEINPAEEEEMRQAPERIRQFLANNADITAVITMSCVAEEVYRQIRQERKNADTVIVIIDEPANAELLLDENVMLLDQFPYRIGWKSAEQLYRQVFDGTPARDIITPHRLLKGVDWECCNTPD